MTVGQVSAADQVGRHTHPRMKIWLRNRGKKRAFESPSHVPGMIYGHFGVCWVYCFILGANDGNSDSWSGSGSIVISSEKLTPVIAVGVAPRLPRCFSTMGKGPNKATRKLIKKGKLDHTSRGEWRSQ